ncbi:hypothetical protein EW026_g2012 [Hermanssonia centrifuga]|uniref:Uncharacterized protein n=1 Tax=Hermanssonia centrifuga TaxID=98765 RepID=A0A4S4KQJ2_9APHY|nr:hypothetical protein EW026_g2012 [Hermanssonia centrifuga]
MDKAAELPYKGNRDRASLLAWEDAWQKTLDDLYSEKKTFAQLTPSDAPLPCDLKLELDVDLRAADVYALQFDVSEEIVKSMAMEDFEKHWLNTPAVHREAFILHGIAITAKGRKEIEPWRRWCPDGTLKVFAADDGRGFLELLRPFMLEDFTSISDSIEPVDIPHPTIDEILSLSKEDMENPSFILPNTIRAFYGEPPSLLYSDPSYDESSAAPEVEKAEKRLEEATKHYDGLKMMMATLIPCWHCGLIDQESGIETSIHMNHFDMDMEDHMLFLVHRNRALTKRDWETVNDLFYFISLVFKGYKFSIQQVREQLEREYGVSVLEEPLGKFGPDPTDDEWLSVEPVIHIDTARLHDLQENVKFVNDMATNMKRDLGWQ